MQETPFSARRRLKSLRGPAVITLAALVYALSYVCCFGPQHIALGGITGLAQTLNRFLPAVPVGGAVIVMNIPLFLLGLRFIGGKLLLGSLYAMVVSSVFIDLLAPLRWPMLDPLLACIFGGVLMGGSLGTIFLQGATTGGTDLVARLLKLKLPWLPMGKLLLGLDLCVVAVTALAFQALETALYGIIALYISTLAIDGVLYGLDTSKVAYIISDREQEIAEAIFRVLDRGVTVLHGEGAYTGASKRVLLCAFKQREIASIKDTIREIDPDAFLIVCDAHDVLGAGFRPHRKHDI